MGKIAVRVTQKDLLSTVLCETTIYRTVEISELQVQCMIKMKQENLYFSQMRYC